jgi:hypothetical protein
MRSKRRYNTASTPERAKIWSSVTENAASVKIREVQQSDIDQNDNRQIQLKKAAGHTDPLIPSCYWFRALFDNPENNNTYQVNMQWAIIDR